LAYTEIRSTGDGTGVTQLTNNAFVNNLAVHDHEPAWSPDGTQIVFTSTRDQPYDHIFVMKADGTGVTRLTRKIKS
jgi:Tol biopolymer transport system component